MNYLLWYVWQKSLLPSKGVAYFKGLLSVQKSQVVALWGPCGVVLIYCKALQKSDQRTFHSSFFSLSFLKLGAKGAASLLLLPCQPNCHVVYLWLVPVWGRSGFNDVVCSQPKQEHVVACGSTPGCANLWLLIMLCLLGVLRLFGVHKERGQQQNTRT